MGDRPDLVEYWIAGAEEALKVATDLFKLKHFSYSLFFCHLATEKALKGILTRRKPRKRLPIHNLTTLAVETGLNLKDEWVKQLEEMNTFNVKAQYNDVRRELHHRATPEYTHKYLEFTKEFVEWIKERIQT